MKRVIHKTDILDSGLQLMYMQGYNATGIKEITDHVGIPKGSFYNHFESKEAFGIEVLRHYWSGGSQNFERRLIKSDLPPFERLNDFFTSLIGFYNKQKECKLGCMLSNFSAELADTNVNIRTTVEEIFRENEVYFKHCLDEAQQQGVLDKNANTSLLASFIVNSWHGAMIRMKAAGSTKPLEDFKTLLFQNVLS